MEWQPKGWLATLLSLLSAPLGMLYLQRARLALVYFLASLLIQIAGIGLVLLLAVPLKLALASHWLVNVIAAFHASGLAGLATPTTTRRWYSRWYGLVGIWGTFAVSALLFRSFLYEPFHMPSDSMYPTLPDDSFVIVKKWGYGDYGSLGLQLIHAEPTVAVTRGELMLFRIPIDLNVVYLKRVIGLPGDRVQCSKEQIVVNGTPLAGTPLESRGEFRFVRETIDGVSFTVAHMEFPAPDCDLTVPDGHYFMLGDNRENSKDSRYVEVGLIPRGNLVGRVAFAVRGADPN